MSSGAQVTATERQKKTEVMAAEGRVIGVDIDVKVKCGRDLVGKDRKMFSSTTTSEYASILSFSHITAADSYPQHD